MTFDSEGARKFLLEKEAREKEERERVRQELLAKVISVLKTEFQGSAVEVFLVGSITRPYSFSPHSDIDIVLKNFKGDRFDLWAKLDRQFDRNVEIILFETCHFQDFVLKEGLRVL